VSDVSDHPVSDGSTPLDPDERIELLPTWIRTRGDLDRAEAAAIAAVQLRFSRRVPPLDVILDDLWLRQLHHRMFGSVWGWAGRYRSTERNIGVDPREVAVRVRDLVADAMLWFRADEADDVDDEGSLETAARFHHRLVWIHPFPNGNGRHARLATDLCRRSLGRPALTWGRGAGDGPAEARTRYLAALRAADAGDLAPLTAFVTS
jgi:Fic-DOC domain mobile mystery protein B